MLFDQGYSTKSEIGRGMGLALSKKALDDVGGEIMFEESLNLVVHCLYLSYQKGRCRNGTKNRRPYHRR